MPASGSRWREEPSIQIETKAGDAQRVATAGDTAAVKALAVQSAPIFRAQGVHREARMACEQFRRAAARDTATADAIRRVVVHLQRAQNDPGLSFAAGGDGGSGSE